MVAPAADDHRPGQPTTHVPLGLAGLRHATRRTACVPIRTTRWPSESNLVRSTISFSSTGTRRPGKRLLGWPSRPRPTLGDVGIDLPRIVLGSTSSWLWSDVVDDPANGRASGTND